MRGLAWALLALGWSSSAFAATGLEWSFDAARRYQLVTRLSIPQSVELMAEKNLSTIVTELQVDLVTTCTPVAPLGKKGWELKCDIDEIALQSNVVSGTDENALEVLAEVDKTLTDAWVELDFTKDGRVKSFDLEGVAKTDRRSGYRAEVLRLILQKTFSLLDFKLPKDGADAGTPWKTADMMANTLFSTSGSGGTVDGASHVVETVGTVVTIGTSGEGHVNSVATDSDILWAFTYNGQSKFDTALGTMVDHQHLVEAVRTATTGGGAPYLMVGRLLFRKADERIAMPVTGILPK